ncbi:MFS transporter [Actinokineospora bangkokensis]|uniref:MFS transporter n=1 Tax=Actinokineospora bangkokensis TaxID=1193682 RepID=A0A1Q9LPE1_9PSEU|nr:MFS transporter [Actinokineospora bangkokensis]OLR93888.1 MFS transporter [Actinokineospora bangkokensis]
MTALLESPADLGHKPGSRPYRRVLGALFAAGVATFALMYSTQALLPEFAAAFGVSSAQSTLAQSLTTVGLGVALLVAGPVSDVVGRTRLIHLSLAASAAVAAACAIAPNWGTLLVLRLLQGVALAGLPAVATAYLREELHPDSHARAAGLYVGGTALGGMAGRLVTGYFGEVAGWRWALGAAAALGVACAVVVAVLLPASRRFVPAPTAPRSLARMARLALTDRRLLALYGIGMGASGAFVGVFNALGFRLTSAPFDLGLGATSLVFLVYVLGSFASTGAGRLADALGRRRVLPPAALLAVAGVALTLSSSLPLTIAGVAVLTAGFFGVHSVASGWVPARAHAAGTTTAQAASLYLFAYYAGSSVFGSLAGQVWTTWAWPGVVVMSAALLLVVGGLGLGLRRPAR